MLLSEGSCFLQAERDTVLLLASAQQHNLIGLHSTQRMMVARRVSWTLALLQSLATSHRRIETDCASLAVYRCVRDVRTTKTQISELVLVLEVVHICLVLCFEKVQGHQQERVVLCSLQV